MALFGAIGIMVVVVVAVVADPDCATFTHLSDLPDLTHLYFTVFVVCMTPAFAHFPPEVAASADTTLRTIVPTRKIPTT